MPLLDELMDNNSNKAQIHTASIGYIMCAAGFLLTVIAFYPGYMSDDSISQLTQGRTWQFDDWHPPVMAAVWGLVDRIIPGPLGMLLLHSLLYWGAAAVFWKTTRRRSVWIGLAIILIGFMPQVLALLGTIWKDVGLGASLFLASALLYNASQTKSKLALWGTVPLLFYGYAIRHNAALAILPLTLWSTFIARKQYPALAHRARILPIALGLLYFALLSIAVVGVTKLLIKGRETYVVQTVWLHDLAAISKAKGEAIFPAYVVQDKSFSLEQVMANYNPAISTAITPAAGIVLTNNPDNIAALRTTWSRAVLDNKAIYLRHRWTGFERLIGFKTDNVCLPYLSESTPNPFGYTNNNGRVRRSLNEYFSYFKNSLLFRGFLWLVISAALVYFSLRAKLRGDFEISFVLATSSLLYGAGYFFYAPACDFRFLWWTTIAALVALIFFVRAMTARWRPGNNPL